MPYSAPFHQGERAVANNRACINCGQPLIVVSATALICSSCKMVEFAATDQVQQQQQQQQAKYDEKQ
jgi:hypothetical protein